MKDIQHHLLRALGLAAAATMMITASSCGGTSSGSGASSAEGTADKTAKLTYVNWAEGVAYTHVAEVVLRDKMGYDVEITSADVGPAYTAVAQGSHDAYMECWPNLHQDYLNKFEGDLVSLGNVYEGTATGLAVPSYVTINTLEELKGNEDKFNGVITGIDAGAGMMKKTENELIPAYDLDIELLASSGPAMTAALKDAVDNEEWIVVTTWKPHWMWGRWDLKFLEQSEDKMIWNEGDIEIIGRVGLEEEKPELAQFLKNFYFTDPQLAALMLEIEESEEDVSVVAKRWVENNPELVASWIPESAM
jgi:glycine betaine/proline transport system substrate-binding protein